MPRLSTPKKQVSSSRSPSGKRAPPKKGNINNVSVSNEPSTGKKPTNANISTSNEPSTSKQQTRGNIPALKESSPVKKATGVNVPVAKKPSPIKKPAIGNQPVHNQLSAPRRPNSGYTASTYKSSLPKKQIKGNIPISKTRERHHAPSHSTKSDYVCNCRFCNENFKLERLDSHEKICEKTVQIRKIFYADEQRDSDDEIFIKTSKLLSACSIGANGKPEVLKSDSWRQKHEESAYYADTSEQSQTDLPSGGNLSNLSKSSLPEGVDFETCPHCLHRFGEFAADTHIAFCAKMHKKQEAEQNTKEM